MKEETKLLLSKIYSIVLTVFTCVLGFVFIILTYTIYFKGMEERVNNPTYQIFTREIIGNYLLILCIPLIIWILIIIAGNFVYKPIKAKQKLDSYMLYLNFKSKSIEIEEMIQKRNKRKLYFLAMTILDIALLIYPCIYLFNPNNYLDNNVQTVINICLNVLPFVIVIFILFALYIFFFLKSINQEIELMKKNLNKERKIEIKKNNRIILVSRIIILSLGIAFIVIGLINGDAEIVLTKAVNICKECIGLA